MLLCTTFVLETRAHRNLFYALALPVFVANLPTLQLPRLRNSPLAKLAALYIGYFLVAGFFGEDYQWREMADLLRVSILLSLFFAVTALLIAREETLAFHLFFWMSLTAAACLVVLYIAIFAGMEMQSWRLSAFGRASQPVIGATLYGFIALVTTFVLLPRAGNWPLRLLWLGIIALSIVFMVLTSSRGPLLALAAGFLLGALAIDWRLAVAGVALAIGAIAVALLYELRAVEVLYLRSQSGHFELWRQALTAIAERPWFGYGSLTDMTFTAQDGPQRSPHNLFLANQIYGGLPATLLLLMLLGRAAWRALGKLRDNQPIYLVLLAFGVAASLFDSRSLVQNLGREWITIWLPIALLAAQELPRQPSAPSEKPPS